MLNNMSFMELTPFDLQKKVYFYLEQLQAFAKELPPKYQQRLPCETLSSLANTLLNDTIFDIVKQLLDIQHVTEKHLFQQRLQILHQHTMDMQTALSRVSSADEKLRQRNMILQKQRDELKHTDMKLVLQLDQKVSDQQGTLEKAGVPGFYVTNNPLEIRVQMYLLDFILRLSKMQLIDQQAR